MQDTSTTILGFSRVEQIDENLKSIDLIDKWTPELEKKIRDILTNDPEATFDCRKWSSMPMRRDQSLLTHGSAK